MEAVNDREVHSLDRHGIKNVNNIYWNLSTPALYEQIVRRREGILAHLGSIVVRTGHHTGRSPKDKFIVDEPASRENIWWGNVNRPFERHRFEALYNRLLAYLQGKDVFIQDCYAGADERYRVPVRVITETAWHGLFARTLLLKPGTGEMTRFVPEFTIINTPRFHAFPEVDGTNSEVFIIVNFEKKLVIIGGTSYAGEIKKSVFTILNYIYPQQGVFSMHCSANVGAAGDVAIFFGLSGTGKTTLSADPRRALIGDDEHGWSDRGVFNFEGGCYAKVVHLSKESEPEIYQCTRRFGTVLENVAIDTVTRRLDLDDDSLTENTRAAYPITHLENIVHSGTGGHPQNIIMLTCDAFGVMPPIARLTPEQAMYHFLSGYTARVAGTEKGLGKEPEATFSTCFGAPFLVLKPSVYANLLRENIAKHRAHCWLVNTGWTGGPVGEGSRMKISYTRAMINAALEGKLENVRYETDPVMGLQVPLECPGVPSEMLKPRNTWRDVRAYDAKANELAARFEENFSQFQTDVPEEVRAAGPRVLAVS